MWTIYKLWKTNEHTILKLWTLIKNIIERTHKFPYNILFTFLMDRGRAPNGIGHLMILLLIVLKRKPAVKLSQIFLFWFLCNLFIALTADFVHAFFSLNCVMLREITLVHARRTGCFGYTRVGSISPMQDLTVWPPSCVISENSRSLAAIFLATETPDIALEYTSREIWSE